MKRNTPGNGLRQSGRRESGRIRALEAPERPSGAGRRSTRRVKAIVVSKPVPAKKAPPRKRKSQPSELPKPQPSSLAKVAPAAGNGKSVKHPAAPAKPPVSERHEAHPANPLRRWKWAVAVLSAACAALALLALSLWFGSAQPGAAKPEQASSGNVAAKAVPANAALPVRAEASGPAARRPSGNLLLAKRGAKASGCDHAGVLIDGDVKNYDGGSGYASYEMNGQKNGAMLVTLPAPVELNRLRILLWDKDDRRYRYVAAVSPDGKKWITVKDAAKTDERSWQDIRFKLQSVKAVRVKGVHNSANSGFHVVEIEGYHSVPPVPKRQPSKAPVTARPGDLCPGLWAEYFDGLGAFPSIKDKPSLVRVEPSVYFGAFQIKRSKQGLNGGNWPFLGGACAAIFRGYIKIEKKDLYTFFIESDDGANLYIDGGVVVENGGMHGLQEIWGQRDLEPGLHRIWIEYFNGSGPMGLNVMFKPRDEMKVALPKEILFHDPLEAQTSGSQEVAARK